MKLGINTTKRKTKRERSKKAPCESDLDSAIELSRLENNPTGTLDEDSCDGEPQKIEVARLERRIANIDAQVEVLLNQRKVLVFNLDRKKRDIAAGNSAHKTDSKLYGSGQVFSPERAFQSLKSPVERAWESTAASKQAHSSRRFNGFSRAFSSLPKAISQIAQTGIHEGERFGRFVAPAVYRQKNLRLLTRLRTSSQALVKRTSAVCHSWLQK